MLGNDLLRIESYILYIRMFWGFHYFAALYLCGIHIELTKTVGVNRVYPYIIHFFLLLKTISILIYVYRKRVVFSAYILRLCSSSLAIRIV